MLNNLFNLLFFPPTANDVTAPDQDFITTLTSVLIELLPSLTIAQQQTLINKAISYLQPWGAYHHHIQQLSDELETNEPKCLTLKTNRDLFRLYAEDIEQWIEEQFSSTVSKDYLQAFAKLATHRRYSNSTPHSFPYESFEENNNPNVGMSDGNNSCTP